MAGFLLTWSPEGTHIAFGQGAGPVNRVLSTPADASGQFEVLLDTGERYFPMSWAPGVLALYGSANNTNHSLVTLPLDGDGTLVPFLETPYVERGGSFSPNWQWLAYVSNKTGQDEIYVRPYPGPGGETIVSRGGGKEAVWGPDGDELFYRSGDRLMVVRVDTGGTFVVGATTELFPSEYVLDNSGNLYIDDAGNSVSLGGAPNYDVAPNGQFVFVEQGVPADPEELQQLILVENWHEELKRLVPVN